MGGPSREREISLRSGKNILKALTELGYKAVEIIVDGDDEALAAELKVENIAVAYIALHGEYGEDGQVQSLLQELNIPFTGSSPEACQVTMNKILTKKVLQKAGLPVPEYQLIGSKKATDFKVPLVVKPVSEGSSFGVSIVKKQEDVNPTIKRTLLDYPNIFVERFIKGREITIGIIGSGEKTQVLPILELVPKSEFYDFKAKYTPGGTSFILPAKLPEALTKKLQDLALQAHQAAGCAGVSRVDMIIDEQNKPWITEINAVPGMTDQSDLPAEAKAAEISFEELVEMILDGAHL